MSADTYTGARLENGRYGPPYFRLVPVRRADLPLLCFSWQDRFYVDLRLPFGSRSSPFIFTTFADAVCWIILSYFGVQFLIHYLDDFFTIASNSSSCQTSVRCILHAFSLLGIPVATDKLVGPSQCLVYLGIEIDCAAQEIRLPQDKLAELISLVSSWKTKKKCTKRDLLSIIGKLSFACKVIKPGRMFLRRLIDLSTSVSSLHHFIHLNSEARADFNWWFELLSDWNGVSIIHRPFCFDSSVQLSTDASLSIGFGGVFGNHWFSAPWPPSFSQLSIAPKELFAIWAAISIWHRKLTNSQVTLFTDNSSCTDVWFSGSTKDPAMLRILRALFFLCARSNIHLCLVHVEGQRNTLADLLSRFQFEKFREAHPSADADPHPVPESVWEAYP